MPGRFPPAAGGIAETPLGPPADRLVVLGRLPLEVVNFSAWMQTVGWVERRAPPIASKIVVGLAALTDPTKNHNRSNLIPGRALPQSPPRCHARPTGRKSRGGPRSPSSPWVPARCGLAIPRRPCGLPGTRSGSSGRRPRHRGRPGGAVGGNAADAEQIQPQHLEDVRWGHAGELHLPAGQVPPGNGARDPAGPQIP